MSDFIDLPRPGNLCAASGIYQLVDEFGQAWADEGGDAIEWVVNERFPPGPKGVTGLRYKYVRLAHHASPEQMDD